MFDQQNSMSQPYGYGAGYIYNGQPAPATKWNNFLTKEEMADLMKNGNDFSLGITDTERKKGICNHRSVDGTQDTLVYDPITGQARCTTCGYVFRPVDVDVTPDTIKEDVSRIIDLLQTIKLMYVDFPANAAREYFQIIPLLEKIPDLFQYAAKDSAKHEQMNWQYNNRNMGTIQMFNNFTNMMNGGMIHQPMQPMYGNPQAPAGYPQAAYAQPNPFGYPGAQPQPNMYQPANPGFAYQPQPTATPVQPSVNAPAAPAADTATVQQTVTV